MNNQRIAARFLEIADRLKLAGANPFRVRAYLWAARSLERLREDVALLAERGQLQRIPGIGPDLATKILEFLKTGKIPDPLSGQTDSDNSAKDLPPELQNLISVSSLDPKIAALLYRRFHIESLDDLERLARSHLLRTLPNLGPRWEQEILLSLETLKRQGNVRGGPPA